MADGFIVRKGGVAEEVLRTTAPTINFVSKTDSEIVVTFTNNDAAEAEIYYGLTSPLTDTVTLATTVTSSNITFSGLNDDTTFTVSAYALVTDPTSKKIKSEIVTTNITTDEAFEPSSLSPQLWLDAADASTITASSGSVSQWNNKGSLGNFTQGTGADQPTTGVTTLNSLNIIDFAADFIIAANQNEWKFLHDGTKYEIFGVVKIGTTANPGTGFSLMGNTAGSGFDHGIGLEYADNDRLRLFMFRGASTVTLDNFSANDFVAANTFVVVSVFADPSNATAADRSEIRINDGTPLKNNTATNAPSSSNPSFALRIGARGNDAVKFTGSIAELIIISGSNVTSNNRTTVINYLADKWGITI